MTRSGIARVTIGLGLLAPQMAAAAPIGADHAFGLGLALGAPNAISAKLYLGGDYNALEFQLGDGDYYGSFGDNIYAHVVYLWHPSVLATANNLEVPWHVGVGGAVWEGGHCAWYDDHFCGYDGDLAVAVRVPVGIDLNLDNPRFQFFGDLVPQVVVVPYIGIDLGLQIGARYYF